MAQSPAPSPLATVLEGGAPEVEITRDMIRRGLIVSPVIVAICGAIWGMHGVWSALYGLAIVLINFAIAAAIISGTARISLGLMMGGVLFGYLIRLGLVLLAFILVKDASWMSRPALGLTVIVTHLGLLIWELKYVAASLAFPGLKPNRSR